MEPSTQAPDSETLSPLSQVKGLTQIALGAAAGAYVASRMNRGALFLTAGLAYAWYKQSQAPRAATQVETELSVTIPEEPAVPREPERSQIPAPQEPTLIHEFLVSPTSDLVPPTLVAPVANAWDDLRAALSPTLTGALAKTEPLVPAIQTELSQPALPEPPPMFEMNLCAPSSPLMLPSSPDGVDLPDEIELPESLEIEEEATSLFITPTSELPSQPISLGLTGPVVVPKPGTQPLTETVPTKDSSLSAPVVVPRDAQARKNFFDWLRG
ncbi:MAG: hypothetical protein ABL974_04495 [Prosthecobacter sp.]